MTGRHSTPSASRPELNAGEAAQSVGAGAKPRTGRQRGGGYGHGRGGVGAASGRRARARRRCGVVLPVSVAENIALGTGYPRRAGLISWRRRLVSQGLPADPLPAWGTSSGRNRLTTAPGRRPGRPGLRRRPASRAPGGHRARAAVPAGPADRRRVPPSLFRPSASGYVAPFRITTAASRDSARTRDPLGWGRGQRHRRPCCLTATDRSRRVRTPALSPSAVAGRTR